MDKDISDIVTEYFALEEIILGKISKLPMYGKDCDCSEPDKFAVVDDDITVCYCLNCGGNISW
jgi:hypothetical protein